MPAGRRVTGGPDVFLSAATEGTAREADRIVREALAGHTVKLPSTRLAA